MVGLYLVDSVLQELEMDQDGFLVRESDWSEAIALALAKRDALELTPEHWLLIQLAREYYNRYHVAPGMRILITLLRKHYESANGEMSGHIQKSTSADTKAQQSGSTQPSREKLNSRYLYRLFSESPGRQVCCYAGLPKPVSCI